MGTVFTTIKQDYKLIHIKWMDGKTDRWPQQLNFKTEQISLTLPIIGIELLDVN